MTALPAIALQFLTEVAGHVLRVRLLSEAEVLQYGGLLSLGLLCPEAVHQVPQQLVAVLLLHSPELRLSTLTSSSRNDLPEFIAESHHLAEHLTRGDHTGLGSP